MKGPMTIITVSLLLLMLLAGCGATASPIPSPSSTSAVRAAPGVEMVLATTTSTYDSGLLDVILPDFEKAHNVKVKVVAVGSGQAIKLGEQGDADIILVHSRQAEDKFVAEGYGTARYDVMYNDYIIIGPPNDPAGIKGVNQAAAAFKKIAQAKATFISRGDDSGTHTKELAIWKAAGVEPKGEWYVSAGQGMGAVLTMANERRAYTLADRGTYGAWQGRMELPILAEGDEALFNPYGIIPVNPARHPQVKYELAQKMVEWMTSLETQEAIGRFQQQGQVLFYPNSDKWLAAHPRQGK